MEPQRSDPLVEYALRGYPELQRKRLDALRQPDDVLRSHDRGTHSSVGFCRLRFVRRPRGLSYRTGLSGNVAAGRLPGDGRHGSFDLHETNGCVRFQFGGHGCVSLVSDGAGHSARPDDAFADRAVAGMGPAAGALAAGD